MNRNTDPDVSAATVSNSSHQNSLNESHPEEFNTEMVECVIECEVVTDDLIDCAWLHYIINKHIDYYIIKQTHTALISQYQRKKIVSL